MRRVYVPLVMSIQNVSSTGARKLAVGFGARSVFHLGIVKAYRPDVCISILMIFLDRLSSADVVASV